MELGSFDSVIRLGGPLQRDNARQLDLWGWGEVVQKCGGIFKVFYDSLCKSPDIIHTLRIPIANRYFSLFIKYSLRKARFESQ